VLLIDAALDGSDARSYVAGLDAHDHMLVVRSHGTRRSRRTRTSGISRTSC
jgi:hypothetical protein